ncbi:MAG: excinuclease ABC subunit UvrC, partial [Cytophagales bacterium]
MKIAPISYPRHAYHDLPPQPGVYQFYNNQGAILYVGKAKNLKKRVASYFTKQMGHLIKTRKMVAKVVRIGCIIVDSEYQALVLENNLIKQHQPRYNVLLKDSKTYPYLCVTQPPFPRLVITKQKIFKGRYFGPFTSMATAKKIQGLIREVYPIRTCRLDLSADNIRKKKFKVCLEYHIERCKGPCEGLQSAADYDKNMAQVTALLKGNFQSVKKCLKEEMLLRAKERDFKTAQRCKERLQAIENYQARSLITHPTLGTLDVIAMVPHDLDYFVSYFHIKKGMIILAQTLHIRQKIEEEHAHILAMALLHFRTQGHSEAKMVLTHMPIQTLVEGVSVVIPQQGDKRKLVDLAKKNAFFFQKEYLNKKLATKEERPPTLLEKLQQALHLPHLPTHIECFDNSNLQGTHPVAGMVCFKHGKPSKSNYRHFHIKSVAGPDDYASMAEVVKRRYEGLLRENGSLPNLVLIDGGKGQLSAAHKVIEALGLAPQIAVISIA